MKINMRVKGGTELRKKINTVREHVKNPVGLYRSWGIETVKWIQMNYRAGGSKLIDGAWKKLSPLTIMARRKGSSVPLLNTGHMMRQWNHRLLGSGVEVGNPMDIARYHEEGTRPYTIKPKNRKFLWFGIVPADRRRGQQLGGHAQHRVASKPYKKFGKTPGIFARIVHHPGLPVRRQLPNEVEIMPTLLKVADTWIEKVTK